MVLTLDRSRCCQQYKPEAQASDYRDNAEKFTRLRVVLVFSKTHLLKANAIGRQPLRNGCILQPENPTATRCLRYENRPPTIS